MITQVLLDEATTLLEACRAPGFTVRGHCHHLAEQLRCPDPAAAL